MGGLTNVMEDHTSASGQVYERVFSEIEGNQTFTITHGFNTKIPEIHVLYDGPSQSKVRYTNYTITGIYTGSFDINVVSPPLDFILYVKH